MIPTALDDDPFIIQGGWYARGVGGAAERRAKTQLQTYPRRSGLPVDLLLNFLALRLQDGLRRFVG